MTRTARVLVLLWALFGAGCFATETEVIKAGQSIRLCGKRFSVRMRDDADGPSRFTWNGGSKGLCGRQGRRTASFASRSGAKLYLANTDCVIWATWLTTPGKKGAM
jgi:hypothetical protein